MATINEIRSDEAADAFNENPPHDLHALIERTGDWLETLTGEPHAANAAMVHLLDALHCGPDGTPASDRDWRAEWADDIQNSAHNMRRGQDMTELMAFSGFGVRPDVCGRSADVREAIEEMVAAFRTFVDSIPSGWGEIKGVRKVALASEARILIDTGQSVSPEQLASLSGLSFRSLQNLLAKKGGSLRANTDGRVAADAALEWLLARPDFKDSVWMDSDREVDDPEDDVHEGDALGEFLFVPIAADGTAFVPEYHRGGGYTVGLKGEEQRFDNYREALDYVASMTRPAWRRPNDKGNWGIVRADRWERRSAVSLGLEARS